MKLSVLCFLAIICYVLVLPLSSFALEQGVQLPSERPVERLKTFPMFFKWIKFQYRWDAANEQGVDAWVNAATAAGYKVLLSVTNKPKDVPTGEAGYGAYGQFMEELAKRMGDKVAAYEIWNEPDTKEEWTDVGMGEINPIAYARLLEHGAAGVKRGNPNAKVVSAALATNNAIETDYFYAYTSNADLSSVDYLGIHLNITKNIPPSSDSTEGFQRAKLFFAPNKPLWVTEFGWGRDIAGIDLITQRKYITEAFQIAQSSMPLIDTMFVWNFGFASENPPFAEWDIEGNVKDAAKDTCTGLTSHECSLKNQNQFLLPEQVQSEIKPITDKTFIDNIKNFASKLLSFLGFSVKAPDILPPRANQQNQAEIPEGVQPKSDTVKKTSEDLGSSTGVGIYQKDIAPEAQKKVDKTCDFEKLYEKANFPDGIAPITSSGCK